MKCGLIWARSARSSASIARVRVRPSSATSSSAETHRASSPVARARPADAAGAYAVSVPTTLPSASSGAMTAERMGQSGSEQVTTSGPSTEVATRVVSYVARETAGVLAQHAGLSVP